MTWRRFEVFASRFVTLLTGHFLVAAQEVKVRRVMLEAQVFFKAFGAMALAAGLDGKFLIELIFMLIEMARSAEPCRLTGNLKLMRHLPRFDGQKSRGFGVAFTAILFNLGMLASQLESGQIVIEV